jgi:AcrR family transcriptional regulator
MAERSADRIRLPGRPRSARTDRAILEAALSLFIEQGYARMSVDQVAVAAGVGKTAIYRRYRSKADLVAAAVAKLRPLRSPPASGDIKADTLAHVRRFTELMATDPGMTAVGTLLAEELRTPELIEAFRERVMRPRRNILRKVLEKGQQRGELRSDADIGLAIDMLVGTYFASHLRGQAIGEDWAERVVEAVWQGIAEKP